VTRVGRCYHEANLSVCRAVTVYHHVGVCGGGGEELWSAQEQVLICSHTVTAVASLRRCI
jgi:hypothetical protein